MRSLVIGAAIVDLMMHIERLPSSGEDILCNKTKTVVGGCAYNVSNTLRNFDIDHDLFVPVGNGPFADIIRSQLNEIGYKVFVDDENEDNGYCLSLIEADGERTFITVEGVECNYKEEWFEGINIEKYQNIYLPGYQVCGSSGAVISKWLKSNFHRDIKNFFFAPGPVIRDIDSKVMETLFLLNPILHLNEMEAKNYTEQKNLEDAIKKIYAKTNNIVVITLGEGGTLFYDGIKIKKIDAVKTKVVDTVGAGDSHIGAIIAGISKGMDFDDALLLANKTASIIVGTSGPVINREKFRDVLGDMTI